VSSVLIVASAACTASPIAVPVGAGGRPVLGHGQRVALAQPPVGRLDLMSAAGLGVDERDEPDVGQLGLPRVGDLDGDDVVAAREAAQRCCPRRCCSLLGAGGQEVRHHHPQPGAAPFPVQPVDPGCQVGCGARPRGGPGSGEQGPQQHAGGPAAGARRECPGRRAE
jgi:hypothetical protein